MSTEYLRRGEYAWHATDKYWQRAEMITAGVDIGLTSSQAVIMIDGEIFAYSNLLNGADRPNGAQKALDAALNGTGMVRDNIHYVVGTGCGEGSILTAKRTVSEIACHARGANHSIGPSLRTILVMGGHDCVAIHCNDGSWVTAFLANACSPAHCLESRCGGCSAAQGRAMQVVADFLAVPIEEVGAMSLSVNDEQLEERLVLPLDERQGIEAGSALPLSAVLSAVCDVLTKSQAIGLLRNRWSKAEILAAYCVGMAHQGVLLLKRMGVIEEFAITGGVAKNTGVVRRLEKELGIRAVIPEPDPQLTGALGAALFARDLLLKSRKAA